MSCSVQNSSLVVFFPLIHAAFSFSVNEFCETYTRQSSKHQPAPPPNYKWYPCAGGGEEAAVPPVDNYSLEKLIAKHNTWRTLHTWSQPGLMHWSQESTNILLESLWKCKMTSGPWLSWRNSSLLHVHVTNVLMQLTERYTHIMEYQACACGVPSLSLPLWETDLCCTAS